MVTEQEGQWRDISGYEAYMIRHDGQQVINKKTGLSVPIDDLNGHGKVLLYKSGRDRYPRCLSIWRLLHLTFPENFIPMGERQQAEDRNKAISEVTHILSDNDVCNMIGSDFWTAEASEQIVDHLIKKGWRPE